MREATEMLSVYTTQNQKAREFLRKTTIGFSEART